MLVNFKIDATRVTMRGHPFANAQFGDRFGRVLAN